MPAITRSFLNCLALTAAVLCTGQALAAAPAWPQSVEAEYSLSRGSTRIGTVTETFIREGESYRIRSETIAAGPLRWVLRDRLVVKSEGRITLQGLQPLRYAFERDKAPGKNVYARFDWSTRKLTSEHDGKTEVLALEPGTQDRLSIMYQFMILDTSGRLPAAWMTNGKNVTRYEYSLTGSEELDTPSGRQATVRVERVDHEDGSRIEVWLATALNRLPVKVRLTHKDGTRDEQMLTRLSIQP
jgi:Protein of unknown function (DUF3108)